MPAVRRQSDLQAHSTARTNPGVNIQMRNRTRVIATIGCLAALGGSGVAMA